LAITVLAASVPASAQVFPAAIGSSVQGGQAAYSITARGQDVCVATYLLDDQGYLFFLRYGLVKAFQTVGVVTGTFVPVFVTFQPANASSPVQRCSAGPSVANLISDPTLLPQIYVVFAPTGSVANIDVHNQNFAAIIQVARQAAVLVSLGETQATLWSSDPVIAQLQQQFANIFQSNTNVNNVSV